MRIEDIQRELEAYDRKTEEYCAEACVELRYMPSDTLQEIFGPPFGPERPNPPFFDEDPFYIMVYEVTPSIAERLNPYFLELKELDFNRYDYFMSASGDGTAIEEPLAAMGDHTCALLLRPVSEIPGGLWSWHVYLDGDVHARGPGSERKDPIHWYATLPEGAHRVVVRDSKTSNPNCKESNTLHFTVGSQTEILVNVSFVNGEINLELSSGAT